MNLDVIGAVVLAIATIAAIAAVLGPLGLGRWWKRQRLAARILIAVPFTAAVIVATTAVSAFFLASLGEDAESQTSTAEPGSECLIAGQVFDLEGVPLPAARIVPRDPESDYWNQVGINPETILATTDGEGRFQGDCLAVNKPFILGVTWEMVLGKGEWCEWWGVQPETRIEADGAHRNLNIQIPVADVVAGAYPYTDDYLCTS